MNKKILLLYSTFAFIPSSVSYVLPNFLNVKNEYFAKKIETKEIDFFPQKTIDSVIPPKRTETLTELKTKLIKSLDKEWLINFHVNELSRLLMIKIKNVSRVNITIKAKNTNLSDLTYSVINNSKDDICLIPIKYLYNNHNNEVKVDFFTEEGLILYTKKINILIKNISTLNNVKNELSIDKKQNISKLQNNLFLWTSGNFQFPRAYDINGQLRWVVNIPSGEETVTSWKNEDTIIVGSNSINLPVDHSSFYQANAYVIDSLGLQKKYINLSEYGHNHDFVEFDNEVYYTIGSDKKNNYQNSNSSLIKISFNKNQQQTQIIDLIKLFKDLLNPLIKDNYNLYNEIFKYEDVLHLNSLKKLDNDRLLIAARAVNSLFIVNVKNSKLPIIEKVITSSKELFNVYKENNETFQKYFINYKDDFQAMLGAHDFLPIYFNEKEFQFEFLDNQNPYFSIAKKIINDKNSVENDYSYHTVVTVYFESNTVEINKRKKLPHSRFRGSVFSSYSSEYKEYFYQNKNYNRYSKDMLYASYLAAPTNKLFFYDFEKTDLNINNFVISYYFENLFRVKPILNQTEFQYI